MLALDHGLLNNVELNANFNFFFTTSVSFLRCQVSEGGENRQELMEDCFMFFVKPTMKTEPPMHGVKE